MIEQKTSRGYYLDGPDREDEVEILVMDKEETRTDFVLWLSRKDAEMILARWVAQKEQKL